ncbi:20S proteasome subunit A/B [Candidatus Nitrospira bockiana]
MYEEPYRWVEAVGNRRQYLDEQFAQGSPVVAVGYDDGILLLTVSRGTPKLYEIYDRIGWGGMGHPADLEKLRFNLLEMAHLEGFNRSPSDVTGPRLVKYGLAPAIKQAFEEVFRAPFIVKILLAELGGKPERDAFLTIDYDGTFEESPRHAAVGATAAVQSAMTAYLDRLPLRQAGIEAAFPAALKAWAVGSVRQRRETEDAKAEPDAKAESAVPTDPELEQHLRDTLGGKRIECALLERSFPGSSKYRPLKPEDVARLSPAWLR